MVGLSLALMLSTMGEPNIYDYGRPFEYDRPSEYNYEERQIAHPYNPGPKIIIAPIPDKVYEHKNLHLPDPTCIAGCDHSR